MFLISLSGYGIERDQNVNIGRERDRRVFCVRARALDVLQILFAPLLDQRNDFVCSAMRGRLGIGCNTVFLDSGGGVLVDGGHGGLRPTRTHRQFERNLERAKADACVDQIIKNSV